MTITFAIELSLMFSARYHGRALVVFGHTPVLEPRWRHETVDIDTGCVFGGALTALRWPERELVVEPARRAYAVPARTIVADPFVAPEVVRRREREERERLRALREPATDVRWRGPG